MYQKTTTRGDQQQMSWEILDLVRYQIHGQKPLDLSCLFIGCSTVNQL
jgi:hypothetical protein